MSKEKREMLGDEYDNFHSCLELIDSKRKMIFSVGADGGALMQELNLGKQALTILEGMSRDRFLAWVESERAPFKDEPVKDETLWEVKEGDELLGGGLLKVPTEVDILNEVNSMGLAIGNFQEGIRSGYRVMLDNILSLNGYEKKVNLSYRRKGKKIIL
jgi:hypothetical protein